MDRTVLRVIDANVNRCREGLRVIEDTARYVHDDARGYQATRKLRHRVTEITLGLYPEILRERNAVQDSGRTIPEGKRQSLEAVLIANFRRAEEALRVLEEYARLIAPDAGPSFKEVRYAVYTLEKKMLSNNNEKCKMKSVKQ